MFKKLSAARKRLLFAVVAAAMIIFAMTPLSAYSAENPLTFTVKQVVNAEAVQNHTFTYILNKLDPDKLVPMDVDGDNYTFLITGNSSVQLGPFAFNQPGIYSYEIYQLVADKKPGHKYDGRRYTIDVHVDSLLGTEIIIFNNDGTKTDIIVFENEIEALSTDPDLMVDPSVRKTVSGNPGHESTFIFRLAAQDASNPMPDGSIDGVKTITITGSGTSEFGTWSYENAGVYYYKVYEADTGERGYTYDTAVYTITDTVREDDAGQLELSRVITNDTNRQVTAITFINTYSGGNYINNNTSGSPGYGPKTGDDANLSLYIAMFALGIVLATGAAIYLVAEGKRGESGR